MRKKMSNLFGKQQSLVVLCMMQFLVIVISYVLSGI